MSAGDLPPAEASVTQRLINAAAELLAGRSPHDVTSKDIAQLAGVNHGQVHHYFGSKDGLVGAVVQRDAHERHDRFMSGEGQLLPIEAIERSPHWRSFAHLVASGSWLTPEYEFAPVVRAAVLRRAEELGRDDSDPEVLAGAAAVLAVQRGWWFFSDLIEAALSKFDLDADALRVAVAERSLRLFDDSAPVDMEAVAWTDAAPDPFMSLAVREDIAEPPRGREAVMSALMLAAIQLLANCPSHDVSAKQIAAEAGVNHGQIYHYFGSKDVLVARAILANGSRFVETAMNGGRRFPLPVVVEHRSPVWRALLHLASTRAWAGSMYPNSPVMDAMVEVRARQLGVGEDDPGVHADVAIAQSMELGWQVYRDVIEHTVVQHNPDLPAIRRQLAIMSTRLVAPAT